MSVEHAPTQYLADQALTTHRRQSKALNNRIDDAVLKLLCGVEMRISMERRIHKNIRPRPPAVVAHPDDETVLVLAPSAPSPFVGRGANAGLLETDMAGSMAQEPPAVRWHLSTSQLM
jgi:hypothetical protein